MRPVYLWDYDIDETSFRKMLEGSLTIGRLDQEWAIVRTLEYAPYQEILRLLTFKEIVHWWPKVHNRIRSKGRKRGFDFLVEWLPQKHPELLYG